MNISLSSSEIRLILNLLGQEFQKADGNYKMMIADMIKRLKALLGE